MSLMIVPVTLDEANRFVEKHHRHHGKVRGHKFSIGVDNGVYLVGVCIVGRPIARQRDDGLTLDVSRLCTDGTKNACSMLYGAAWRAAKAMGYQSIGTYILDSEDGTALVAAGWRFVHTTRGGTWNRPSRSRTDSHPTGQKQLWETS